MIAFEEWCDFSGAGVGAHELAILSARPRDLPLAEEAVAAVLPSYYSSEEHIARILQRLGKARAAALIREKLPVTKSIRSGDLGEILATEYITGRTTYDAPIKRLRWKDHREMAMRGEDIIAIERDPATARLRFLKTESKSRVSLAPTVLTEAREALDKDNGLPSAHALSFISARLMEIGNHALADAIDDAQLKDGIAARNVSHLLFTLSGNDPTRLLRSSLENYEGSIAQSATGVCVATHANFVRTVYEKVMANGDHD
jgi:hypothetical protein